jgi:cytochrome bd ubiquinol oxidase subunit II
VTSWLNPTSAVLGALAVLAGGYLAAVYMAADAARSGLPDLVRAFRVRALAAGVLAGALAAGALVVLRSDAPALYEGLTSGTAGPVSLAVSGAAGVATLALVAGRRFPLARFSAAVAVAAVTVGWAFAQHPDLLPGGMGVAQAAADEATLIALLASVAAGTLVLAPSLWLLYALTLRGRLDPPFRPLSAGDRPPER